MVEFHEPSQEDERRQEPRFPTTGRASLNWSTPTGLERSTAVDVSNVNQEGLQVELTEDVELESPQFVHLVGEAYECRGRIRYRAEKGSVTVIGIEFAR